MSIFNSKTFEINKTETENDPLSKPLIPITNNLIDIGTDINRFKNLYLSGNINNSQYMSNKVLITNNDKSIVSSSITDTEINY